MLRRIFIGGTGRSGTWVLYKALGGHAAVHAFPAELRFLIDPDGLIGLVDDLTIRYSPTRAREALFRFEKLMRIHLATPGKLPYAAIDLPHWLGGDYYWQRLNMFCNELVEIEYQGFSWNVERLYEGRLEEFVKRARQFRKKNLDDTQPSQEILKREYLREGKYFPRRNQVITLAAQFVDDLLLRAAHAHGKLTWCEKTPQHLLHLDFLWELFPESFFIHVKRDPRGVAHSLMKQKWGPNDLKGACLILKNVYSRWFCLKETLNLDQNHYLELKLEDIVIEPEPILEKITILSGLENEFSDLPEFSLDKVNYWQKTLSRQEIKLINDLLYSEIEQMGYQV